MRSFMYGPAGEVRLFDSEEDAPDGWSDHPAPPDDSMAGLRAAYVESFGKKPYMGWDEATLREKLAAAPE